MNGIVMAATSAFDVATAIVAFYAAIVATAALAFQVFSWARSWQTRVEVTLRRMSLVSATTDPEPVVLFDIINHSGHPVKITHVGIGPLKKGGRPAVIPHPLGRPVAGAFEIPSRDSTTVWIKPETLDDYDAAWKTWATIATSDGRSFESKKVRVGDLVRD